MERRPQAGDCVWALLSKANLRWSEERICSGPVKIRGDNHYLWRIIAARSVGRLFELKVLVRGWGREEELQHINSLGLSASAFLFPAAVHFDAILPSISYSPARHRLIINSRMGVRLWWRVLTWREALIATGERVDRA